MFSWADKIWAKLFPFPTEAEIKLAQLQYAQRELLAAWVSKEHAQAMIDCHTATIARLQAPK